MLKLHRHVVVFTDIKEWIWIERVWRLHARATPDSFGNQLHGHDWHDAGLPCNRLQVVATHRLCRVADLVVEGFARATILSAADERADDGASHHVLAERCGVW